MIRFAFTTALILAGCSTPQIEKRACEAGAAYAGPELRAPLANDAFPAAQLDLFQAVPARLASALEVEFTSLVAEQTDATRAAVALWEPGTGSWSASYGDGPSDADAFWWASVGKMATATVILQLVEEDKLSLDQRLSVWLPDFPDAALITVDQLLTHTSGVFSFNEDPAQQEKTWPNSFDRLIETSARNGLDFCPGTNWHYSNTGYLMLSHIAEQVEGKSFAEIVDARIAQPLSLSSFAVIEADDAKSSMVPTGGPDAPDAAELANIAGAGAIRSTPEDMLVFLSAYLNAELFSEQTRTLAFQALYPMFNDPMAYGRGVMTLDVPDPDRPTVWVGHVGGSPNGKAMAVYDVEREAYIAVVLNTQAPAEAIANTLLKRLDAE
ncbi:MAG: serine hydrolase domain-containing protein [Pseudomonadota bacterium]